MPGRIVDHLQWVGVIAVIVVVCSLVAPRTSIRASVLGSLVTPDEETGARNVPPRIIPVPDTVSPELRSAIAAPLAPKAEFWRRVPRTTDEWRAIIAETDKQGAAGAAELLKHYPVKVEQSEIAGIKTYLLTPEQLPEENRERVLVHLHGGAHVFYGGEACIGEGILMAHYAKMKVISVDYRRPPDHPFPAPLVDAVGVYKELLATYKPSNMAIFGTSSGGGLAAAAVLSMRKLGLPLPGAVGLGTPWVDITKTGDTLHTNEEIDDVLVTYGGLLEAAAKLYAGQIDMKHPLVSPVYGDFSKGFPPAILTSGTRDLLLSCTVRMHRKLRQAGIEAELHVFEGMSHAEYLTIPDLPEGREAFQEMARFFNKHLGKQ